MKTIRIEKPHALSKLSVDRHGVIEASAGTGKTYTLKYLVVELLLSESAPTIDSILIMTFTRRATADLRLQIREVLTEILSTTEDEPIEDGADYWEIDAAARQRLRQALLHFEEAQIYTIHSFCQRLLLENAFENDQLFDLKHVDEGALFEDCFQDFVRGPLSQEPALRERLDAWLGDPIGGTIDDLKQRLLAAVKSDAILRGRRELDFEVLLDEVNEPKIKVGERKSRLNDLKMCIISELRERMGEEFEARKERDGLYCYDDMLTMVLKSLEDSSGRGARFLENIRAQYQFALVDEFQDTDPTQWEIIRRIFVDDTEAHRLYIVGDPKQSIYGFRGADVWAYLRASRALGGERAVLGHNYRSTREMVAAYNEIFRQDGEVESPFFACPAINYADPVQARPDNKIHRVRNVGRSEPGTPAAIYALEIGKDESPDSRGERWKDWMITEIWSLLYGEERLEVDPGAEGKWKPVSAGDIFVLTNSGRDAVEMGQLLRERGIPFSFFRQEGLLSSLEAQDILSLLKGIANPRERSYRRAAYRTPFFEIPLKYLASFDDHPTLGGRAQARLNSWSKEAEKKRFVRLFERIIKESGLYRREILLGASAQSLTNYEHIFELLTVKAASDGVTLEDLISWLEAKIAARQDADEDGEDESDIQRQESERPAVQVMTIHKSKGLEAEVVFIYGGFSTPSGGKKLSTFVDAKDPADESAQRVAYISSAEKYMPEEAKERYGEQQAWEDERVMYVAITRAKSRVYMCYANQTLGKTGRRGRHAPLVRGLDRIRADKEATRENPALDYIQFIPVGDVGSHPESEASRGGGSEQAQLGEFAKFWLSLHAGDEQDSADRKWPEVLKIIKGEEKRERLRAPSPRQSHSFSGISRYQGGEVGFKARVDEEEVEQELDPEEEKSFEEKIRGDRFGEETPILWGGIRSGSLLHDILEEISDYKSVFDYKHPKDWLAESEAGEVIRQIRQRYREPEEVEPYMAQILFDTLKAPLKLPGGKTIQGIGVASRLVKEKSFRFIIPEAGMELGQWERPQERPWRGWIEGSIDLIFEVDGKIYLADWKSSVRESYEEQELQGYLETNYKLQVQLYILALVQMLGIKDGDEYEEKFGGCAYFFVRAMRPERPGEGVAWARRPKWGELKRWYREMGGRRPGEWREIAPVFSADEQRGGLMDKEELTEVSR